MVGEYLFAYGSFRESARNLIGDFINCGLGTIDGKIYKIDNRRPAFKPGNKGQVIGSIYMIDGKVLKKLDDYEGEDFTRERIIVNDILCWIYIYNPTVKGKKPIEGGDWLLRK